MGKTIEGARVNITCISCGKEFIAFRSQYANGRKKYCSRKCSWYAKVKDKVKGAYRPTRSKFGKWAWVTVKCDYCGAELSIKRYRLKRLKHHFCKNERACYKAWMKINRVGKNHPSFGKIPSPKIRWAWGGYRKDLGHYVRSSWEANIARWLLGQGLEYVYEKETFIFETFSYTPDFYVPKWDKYIEVKGYWRKDDYAKVEAFTTKYGVDKLWIIDRSEYERLGFNPNETRGGKSQQLAYDKIQLER